MPTGTTGAERRIVLRRVLAGLLAAVALVPFFGLVDLGTVVGLSDPAYRWEMPLEASWGAFFTFLVGGAYLWLAIGRRAAGAVLQLAIAVIALLLAAAAAADAGPLVVALGIAASLALLVLLDPGLRPRRGGWALRLPSLVLAVAAAAVWLPYSVTAIIGAHADSRGDETNGIAHWPVQAALGIAVLLGAGALAVRCLRPLRVALVLSALVVALTDLAYPDRAGAMGGTLWAAAAIAWAVLAAAAALLERGAATRGSAAPAGTPPAASSVARRGRPRRAARPSGAGTEPGPP